MKNKLNYLRSLISNEVILAAALVVILIFMGKCG